MTPPLVVVLGRGLPQQGSPLLGCFEWDQARALDASGVRVVYAALDPRSLRRRRRFGHGICRVEGIDVSRLSVPLGALPVALNHAVMTRLWAWQLARIVQRFGEPDVVHAHFSSWGAAAVAVGAGRKRSHAVVVTAHSSTLTAKTIVPDVRWLVERVCRADRVIAVSSGLADVLRREFNTDATVVGNVIDLDSFVVHPRTAHSGTQVVSTGNLVTRKRTDLLIDGFAMVADRRDGVSLLLIGDGPERPRLADQITRRGLDDRVRLVGPLSRAAMAETYRGSDLFAMVSAHETFGVVWAEALAAGLPVVASKITGPDDFVDETVGEWAGDTPESVAAALERLIDRLPGLDRDRLRAHVADRFSGPAVAARLREVYREVRPDPR